MAMVRVPGKDTAVSEHPITLPLDKVLDRLTASVPQRKPVRITLSCGHCPAVTLNLPKGAMNWSEHRALAQAWAVDQLRVAHGTLACEFDERHRAVAAALPTPTLEAIHSWAKRGNRRVTSIRPLWSYVTEWVRSTNPKQKALSLREPDGITLVIDAAETGIQASTMGGDDSDAAELEARNWLLQSAVGVGEVLHLGFGGARQVALPHTPRQWAGHWFSP